MSGGRPTKYSKDIIDQVRKLANLGLTDLEMLAFFDVSERTWNNWKKAHAEFLQALKEGKTGPDSEVADKLFKRATGYSFDEVTKEYVKLPGQKAAKLQITKVVTKHVVPDVTAQIFWLKNRDQARWRDRHEHTGKDGKDLVPEVVRVEMKLD